MRSFIRSIRISLVVSVLAMVSVTSYSQNAGLTLGGHFVPQDSFMLFIDMGNSAMSGRDKQPDLVTDPHLWKFEMDPANYDWLLAKEPICVDEYNFTHRALGRSHHALSQEAPCGLPELLFWCHAIVQLGMGANGKFQRPGQARSTPS